MSEGRAERACEKCDGTGKVPNERVVGAMLRDARVKAEVSLREAARRLGCSAAHMSNLERGRMSFGGDLGKAALRMFVPDLLAPPEPEQPEYPKGYPSDGPQWLVEREEPGEEGRTVWYLENVLGRDYWTADANLAFRCLDEAHAQRMAKSKTNRGTPCKATEHVFLNRSEPEPETEAHVLIVGAGRSADEHPEPEQKKEQPIERSDDFRERVEALSEPEHTRVPIAGGGMGVPSGIIEEGAALVAEAKRKREQRAEPAPMSGEDLKRAAKELGITPEELGEAPTRENPGGTTPTFGEPEQGTEGADVLGYDEDRDALLHIADDIVGHVPSTEGWAWPSVVMLRQIAARLSRSAENDDWLTNRKRAIARLKAFDRSGGGPKGENFALEIEDGEGWKPLTSGPLTVEELAAKLEDYRGMPNPVRASLSGVAKTRVPEFGRWPDGTLYVRYGPGSDDVLDVPPHDTLGPPNWTERAEAGEALGYVVVETRDSDGVVIAIHSASRHVDPWAEEEAKGEAKRLKHNDTGYPHSFAVVPVGASHGGVEALREALVAARAEFESIRLNDTSVPRPGVHGTRIWTPTELARDAIKSIDRALAPSDEGGSE